MEIFENSDFGMLNVRFSEIPTDEQKKILKENGYRWSARKNLWYPMTQEAQQEVDKAKFLENIRKNDAAKNPLQEKQAEILSNDAGGLFSGLNSTEIFAPKVQTQKHNHKDDEISY
jgi:hypothetical protein